VYAEGKVNLTRNGISVKASQTANLDFALIENTVSTTSHPVNVDGQTFYVVIVGNSTISSFAFDETANSVSFSVSAATGSAGFCDVIIPETFLIGPYTVKIDGFTIEPVISSNGTHVSIHFSYTHSIHEIEIVGSAIIPEFPTNMLLLASVCAMSLLALLIKKKRKSWTPTCR
jgi:hypothetical protein